MASKKKGVSRQKTSRQKRHMPFNKNIRRAIEELCGTFGIPLPPNLTRFTDLICEHNRKVVTSLGLDSGRTLVWTVEDGKRKLFLVSPYGGQAEERLFEQWTQNPYASRLRHRKVRLEFNRYAVNPEDIINAADPGIPHPS
jgi:hypothetical protein